MPRTLVIADPHEPFSHRHALKHACEARDSWECEGVIFVGDVFDHHRMSRHVSEPDGRGAVAEWKMAKRRLKHWVTEFPKSDIVLGNHDLIPKRQAKEVGIPKEFLRDLHEVYDIPDTWKFHNKLVRDKVLYLHAAGSGKYGAINKAREMSMSVVCGHTHTTAGVVYSSNPLQLYFGMNCGCLIDKRAYAMRYSDKEPVLGVGIVISATEAYFEPMKLR